MCLEEIGFDEKKNHSSKCGSQKIFFFFQLCRSQERPEQMCSGLSIITLAPAKKVYLLFGPSKQSTDNCWTKDSFACNLTNDFDHT